MVLVAAPLMFACGTTQAAGYAESHSASEIISDGSGALKSAHSAHVAIQGTYQGSAATFEADVEDRNASGSITFGSTTLKLIIYSGKLYLYGPDLIVLARTADAALTAKVGDKWVLMPDGVVVDQRGLQAFGDFSGMADCIKSGTGFSKKGTATIRGVSAVEIQSAAGSQIFVQTSAPHYPIRIAYTAGDKACSDPGQPLSGTIDLTRIGAHFGITAPPNSTDFASLGLTAPRG